MSSHPVDMIAIGFIIGTIGTLIGAGGGFLLVPILLLLDPHMAPDVVTGISLAVVFFNAASGSVAYARMGRIAYKPVPSSVPIRFPSFRGACSMESLVA
jgi:uncharacterized protein